MSRKQLTLEKAFESDRLSEFADQWEADGLGWIDVARLERALQLAMVPFRTSFVLDVHSSEK